MTSYDRYPLQKIDYPPATQSLYQGFLRTLEVKIESGCDRNLICREAAKELYTGVSELRDLTPDSSGEAWHATLLSAHFDPRNVTLEAERYGDCDRERYLERKPFIWLWYLFDRSPLGMNVDFGFQMRQLLARYVFKSVGKNFKCFPFVELAFGYNTEIGDDVVIHRWVNLDDRAGIVIGDRSSLSDFVNIYSHTHDINEQDLVANIPTIIEADCRITYHATLLAGSHVRRGSMVGAHALLTSKDVPAGEVWIGLPARRRVDKEYFIDKPSGERWSLEELQAKYEEGNA